MPVLTLSEQKIEAGREVFVHSSFESCTPPLKAVCSKEWYIKYSWPDSMSLSVKIQNWSLHLGQHTHKKVHTCFLGYFSIQHITHTHFSFYPHMIISTYLYAKTEGYSRTNLYIIFGNPCWNYKYFPNILLFGFYKHKHGQIQHDRYYYSSKHNNFPRILQYILGLWFLSEGKSFSFLVLQKSP